MRYKFLFTAGGTGGHIFPAIAVAKEINFPVIFITGKYGMEEKIFKNESLSYKTIPVKGLGGINVIKKLERSPNVLISLSLALFYLLKFKPSVIVGFGGYVSFPVLFWAKILKKKYYLQEQNRIPGYVTKLFSKGARAVFSGFPDLKLEGKKIYTGNPLRKEFYNIPLKENISLPLNIFVIGGSQGSKFLDETILEILPELKGMPVKINHQARQEYIEKLKEKYKEYGIENNVFTFTDKPWKFYKEADIVISRAGALTVSEVIAAGRCAIFIPFKGAVGNHQFYNAKILYDLKASFLIEENEKSKEELLNILNEIIKNPEIIKEMGERAKKLENKEGLKIIKETLLEGLEEGEDAF